ncbi:uncharacterized protein [Drosophila takahashii]|uniref:uncharacterized protein isoform X2 n=1 Tax=Drosophila takahashii TaxID=29030 RepID=UPI003898F39A
MFRVSVLFLQSTMRLYTISLVLLFVIHGLNGYPFLKWDEVIDHFKKNPIMNPGIKFEKNIKRNPNEDNNITVGSQNIHNLNKVLNNITLPEIQMPQITVVVVKDAKALAKYREKSKNSKSHEIIIQRPKGLRTQKGTEKKEDFQKDVKNCVLMKVKELNVIKD